jgi:hypothetical protein
MGRKLTGKAYRPVEAGGGAEGGSSASRDIRKNWRKDASEEAMERARQRRISITSGGYGKQKSEEDQQTSAQKTTAFQQSERREDQRKIPFVFQPSSSTQSSTVSPGRPHPLHLISTRAEMRECSVAAGLEKGPTTQRQRLPRGMGERARQEVVKLEGRPSERKGGRSGSASMESAEEAEVE